MRIKLLKHPLQQTFFYIIMLCFGFGFSQAVHADDMNIPITRSIATQPVTKLEVIAIVKSILNGRVLSVKKHSTYTNPDCHHVKFLEDQGEFQMIKLGCYIENIVQTRRK